MKHQPITKATAAKLVVDDYYDYLRTANPREYAKYLKQQRQSQESERFFNSEDGQSLMAELEAWMATPEMVAWQAEQDRKWEEQLLKLNGPAYRTLDVQPGATQTQIKRAYRRKARELHPDKGGSEAAMKKLNAAYAKLVQKPAKKA